MSNFKAKTGSINARCAVVVASEEAKGNTEIQSITFDILKAITGWDNTQSQIRIKQNDDVSIRKEIKIAEVYLAICAADATHMLESIKPVSEADPKNIINKTELQHNKKSFLSETSEIMINQLKAKKAELLEHGYSETQINDLEKAFNKHKSGTDRLMLVENEIKQLRNRASALEEEVADKLALLNTIIMVNKMLMPKLYTSYFAVKLHTYKNPPASVTGSITWNGEPLANTSVKLFPVDSSVQAKAASMAMNDAGRIEVGKGKKPIFEKLTNSKGEFNTRKLKPGEYRGIISKNGHSTEEVVVYVNPKETTIVSVNLDKL